jgi:DnaJ-class molecular chaperone
VDPEPSVQIRETCRTCDGTGKREVQTGAGYARWAKKVPCPDCEGTGRSARWIPLSELRALLDAGPGS